MAETNPREAALEPTVIYPTKRFNADAAEDMAERQQWNQAGREKTRRSACATITPYRPTCRAETSMQPGTLAVVVRKQSEGIRRPQARI